jgi:hypothetical protein
MGALIEGWHVVQAHSTAVLALTACILWGGALALGVLRGHAALTASPADRLSLAAAMWLLPAFLLSVLALLLEGWLGREGAALRSLFLAALFAVPLVWSVARQSHSVRLTNAAAASLLVGATIILVILRLAFVQGLLFPQYFDSAAHYGLIGQLLEWAAQTTPEGGIVEPATPYYHLGYHFLMAGMVSIAKLHIGELMLVSGQLILALIPVALYALAHRLSGSASAAFLAVALAAAGWYMPAFAANWGKYPALFSLPLAIGALTLALMALETTEDAEAQRRLWILSVIMTVVASLVHTRALVIILAAAAAFALSRRLWRLPTVARTMSVGLTLLALAVLVWFISSLPALRPGLEPYHGTGLWPTLLVCTLTVAAFTHRPQTALALCVFLTFLMAGLIIPAPLPGLGTILDRPFVEVWIFAPLSILGAVGFAGLVSLLRPRGSTVALAFVAVALGAHALATYDLKASSCCTIVTPDDTVALNWLGQNSRAADLVGIATEPLRLGPERYPTLGAPVDAGAWINPLTGIGVVPLAYNLDLGQQAVLEGLCRRGVRYLYIGGSERGFDAGLLRQQPARFAIRLWLPGASVVELEACSR